VGVLFIRIATVIALLVAGSLLLLTPERAPLSIALSLLLATWPIVRAWRAARGTALRASVVWASIAVGLGILSQMAALVEPFASGQPIAGHLSYLTTMAAIAMLISVLGARKPGEGAWAILMSLLLLVFLIPWLEGPGLGRGLIGLDRLRLEQPWRIFYGLLVVTGVTNYLPTRYRLAAVTLGLGFYAEYRGLTSASRDPRALATLWSTLPFMLASALFVADLAAPVASNPPSVLEATWFWFRDHWGVVWALRVLERFNASARAQRWPIQLTWHGLAPSVRAQTDPVVPEEAEATFKSLLRRFADPARIDELAGFHEP
jgi:hypothetical protein